MLRLPMATKDNKGFFIRPPRELINKLEKAANDFKKNSANQVAVEVITEYLGSWIEIETVRRDALAAQQNRHQAKFEEFKEEVLRQTLVEAKVEPNTRPSAKRKTR